MMEIRNARPEDLPASLAIFNDAILNSNAVYTETPRSLEAQAEWFAQRQAQHCPVLVAAEAEAVAAFASYGPFRPWPPGYRYTVENSIFVAPGQRGRGIGGRLLPQLIERAKAGGFHAMVAAIDAENAPSLRLHSRAGFFKVAQMPEVAWKFGRWLDLVFLQKLL
jgi:phosphinothricin acetyltransferase